MLYRKEREEREQDVHRLSFTREQEQQLRDVLADAQYKVMNKPEILNDIDKYRIEITDFPTSLDKFILIPVTEDGMVFVERQYAKFFTNFLIHT